MKKSEIVLLYNGLNSVGNLAGVIFSYCVNKNLNIITPEIEALQRSITPSKEFLEYDNKRIEIVKKYAAKDGKGEFIMKVTNGQQSYDVGENEKVIEDEMLPIREEYKEVISNHEKQMTEYNALLDTDSNVELYKVKLENVPKDITAQQMKSIFLIIEE